MLDREPSMIPRSRRTAAFVLSLCVLPLATLQAEEIQKTFVGKGLTAKVGGYSPVRAEMDKDASIVTKAPEGLKAPKYGQLELDGKKWAFIVDEPEEGDATLYVDSDGDGDLTNDAAVEWQPKQVGDLKQYFGNASLKLDADRTGAISMYRFDPKDPRREQLKNTLLYYGDYGYQLSFKLDGKEMSTYVAGSVREKSRLSLDRDGNGRVSPRLEVATVGKPFNFTGTTYVFNVTDGELSLEKAAEPVDMTPLPPDLAVGKKALTFTAKTMDGAEISFPDSFKGKIVMLDFWATWCGPCIGEIPHMKEAYAEYHDKGFEILGVSFDQKDMEEKVLEFMKEKEITWPQIYEGKLWETSLGIQHDVSGIPFVLLVDGDTGEILADARQLRGDGLKDLIGKMLEKKSGKTE